MPVDTAVWLDLLRDRETKPVVRLKWLLHEGEAVIAPVILEELLQGASRPESFEWLRAYFAALPLPMPKRDAGTRTAAAVLYARCLGKAVTPGSLRIAARS